jgi:hypothetical protein
MEHSEYSKSANEHVRDEFISDFTYPDGKFFEEENQKTFYDMIRAALDQIDDISKTIVFVRRLNPFYSLREIAKVVNVSYETVRIKLINIERKYPILFKFIDLPNRANYQRPPRKRTVKVKKIKINNKNNKQTFLNL